MTMNRKVTHPTPTRRTLLALLAAGTLALSGCGDDEPPGWDRPVEQAAPVKPFVVPAAIEQLMATEFPADGQIHVIRAVGRFDIRPETVFCSGRDGFVLDGSAVSELLRRLGQQDHLNGSNRSSGITNETPFCRSGNPILVKGRQSNNRDGQPYKLVLAVWQGDTRWVAGVERVEGGPRPRIFNPYGTDPLPIELTTDMQSLSAYFIENAL